MKKLFLYGILVFAFIGKAYAQTPEVKPGEQAQGMSNFQNTTVDHCTGRFSYSIPLFELTSGDYKLPVVLSYTANGVKTKDQAGACGHGWDLLCGGVVTRTLRGGIPDENYYGYTRNHYTDLQNADIKKLLHKRIIDGESDIFTAVFNGRKVSFILERGPIEPLQIVPLEKTNLLITFQGKRTYVSDEQEILSFTITDENGISYVFSERETTKVFGLESGVARNSVVNKTYASSWYLTEIKIPSAPNIYFHYTQGDTSFYKDYRINSQMLYQYGAAMTEYKFTLSPEQQTEINGLIDAARWYLNYYALQQQMAALDGLSENISLTSSQYNSALMNSIYMVRNTLQFMDKCMGILGDIGGLSESSAGIINTLNNMINAASHPQLGMYKSILESIKRIYKTAITTPTFNFFNQSSSAQFYRIYTRYLTKVTCGEKEILDFSYKQIQYPTPQQFLTKLTLRSFLHKEIGRVDFTIDRFDLLKVIDIRSNGEQAVRKQTFSYHGEVVPVGTVLNPDLWGYYKRGSLIEGSFNKADGIHIATTMYTSNITQYYASQIKDGSVDDEWVKRHSLKQIKNSWGAELTIDYEPNILSYNDGINTKHGGIRIKSLSVKDGTGQADSIRYHYARGNGVSSGRIIVTGYTCMSILNLGNASDKILHDQPRHHGLAILTEGNNGIMYEYVREEHVGNGSSAYYFFIPVHAQALIDFPKEYAYWLYGLPIGRVDYDTQGRTIYMQKNSFYASMPSSVISYPPSDFIYTNQQPFPFILKKDQQQSFDFFLDEAETAQRYRDMPNILLYTDGMSSIFLSPYNDIYLPNLFPRTNSAIQIPYRSYYLWYGGKAVLKESKEYFFDQSSMPVQLDLFSPLPANGYVENSTNYYYGTNHCDPIRVSQSKSDGSRVDIFNAKVSDIGTIAEFLLFAEMKAKNIVAPTVVQQTYLSRNGQTYLTDETVTLFGKDTLLGKEIYYPTQQKSAYFDIPKLVSNLPSSATISNLFSQDTGRYEKTQWNYTKFGAHFKASEMQKPSSSSTVIYDKENGKAILQAQPVRQTEVAIIDRYRLFEPLNDAPITDYCTSSIFETYISEVSKIKSKLPDFTQYTQTCYVHQLIESFFYDITSGKPYEHFIRYQEALNMGYNYFNFNPYIMTGVVTSNEVQIYMMALAATTMYMWQFSEEDYQQLDIRNTLTDIPINEPGRTLFVSIHNKYQHQLILALDNNKGNTSAQVNYTVKYRNGTTQTRTETVPISFPHWGATALDINLEDFPNTQDIQSLECMVPEETGLAVLAPKGVSYEALSHDCRGRIFCKVNHLKQFERYEYEGLGRIEKIFDHNGNLLQQIKYQDL